MRAKRAAIESPGRARRRKSAKPQFRPPRSIPAGTHSQTGIATLLSRVEYSPVISELRTCSLSLKAVRFFFWLRQKRIQSLLRKLWTLLCPSDPRGFAAPPYQGGSLLFDCFDDSNPVVLAATATESTQHTLFFNREKPPW